MNRIVVIDEKTCTGCGRCVKICPKQILSVDPVTKKCTVSDENACDRLSGCMKVCNAHAILIY